MLTQISLSQVDDAAARTERQDAPRRFAGFLIAGVLAAALAGCVQSGGQTGSVAAAGNSGGGLGSASVDPTNAYTFFKEICVDTAPNFRNAPLELKKKGFVQRPKTNNYDHPKLDLSVELFAKRCSMVFGSKAEPAELFRAIAVATVFGTMAHKDRFAARARASARVSASGEAEVASFKFGLLPTHGPRPMYRAVFIIP